MRGYRLPLAITERSSRLWVCRIESRDRDTVLMVPLAPARDGNPKRCRPIGCYEASKHLANQYRRDR
jgi:hypothetical protein